MRRIAFTCSSNVDFSTEIGGSGSVVTDDWVPGHYVSWRSCFDWEERRYRRAWMCDCEKGRSLPTKLFVLDPDCSHVAEAKKQRCGWNAEADPEKRPSITIEMVTPAKKKITKKRTQLSLDTPIPVKRYRCPECGERVYPVPPREEIP